MYEIPPIVIHTYKIHGFAVCKEFDKQIIEAIASGLESAEQIKRYCNGKIKSGAER